MANKIQMEVIKMVQNLDALINKIGSKIAESIDQKDKTKYKNEIDKSLGVLSNDGVYAYYVYVKSKKVDDVFLDKIKDITNYTETKLDNNDYESYFQSLSQNLNDLLFFREILEKILIYARYHAKAMGD